MLGWDDSQSDSLSDVDMGGGDEDDRWSVETVVEVLELDCDRLARSVMLINRLPDCLLLVCLACLLIRILQVLFELLLDHLQDKLPLFST